MTNSVLNEIIEKEIGFSLPIPVGPYILLKTFKREEKRKSGVIIPSSSIDQDKYQTRVGLVLAMGEDAYEKERFPLGPRCKVGDWVIFRRYELSLIRFNGVDLGFLFDDKVCLRIEDPSMLANTVFDGRN